MLKGNKRLRHPRSEGRGDIDQALVGRSPEDQRQILEIFHEFAVHQNIEPRKEIVRVFSLHFVALDLLKGISAVAPNRLLWEALLDRLGEISQYGAVLWLERFPAEDRQSSDIRGVKPGEDLLLCICIKRLPVAEIPSLRLEASVAVMCAAGDKQGNANTGTIGYVGKFDGSIVHQKAPVFNFDWRALAVCWPKYPSAYTPRWDWMALMVAGPI